MTRQQPKTTLVVTSIQRPNDVMRSLARGAIAAGWRFVVIGDKKGPDVFELPGVEFLSLQQQATLPFAFAKLCPTGHYARKNIGYLIAMSQGAEVIVETDDDNFPRLDFFRARERTRLTRSPQAEGWVNVYRYFHHSTIWPRGFPLRYVREPVAPLEAARELDCPIQQGLADDNPDVDAIYRLVSELPVTFDRGMDVALVPSQFCPFNSQNTTFFKETFPLLYLPARCSFRMTDIWRSFVALRICHAQGWSMAFHDATVFQERNDHDLMRDFEDEVDGYLKNESIVELLRSLPLAQSRGAVPDSLRQCYEALTHEGFIDRSEMALVDAWLGDVGSLGYSDLRHVKVEQ